MLPCSHDNSSVNHVRRCSILFDVAEGLTVVGERVQNNELCGTTFFFGLDVNLLRIQTHSQQKISAV